MLNHPITLCFLLVNLIFASCSQLGTDPSRKKYLAHTSTEQTSKTTTVESGNVNTTPLPSINIVDRPSVHKWITYFVEKDKNRFQEFIDRGHIYKDVVQTILKDNNLPIELYYLALIESGYSNHAYSPAHAVGAWQFMKGTAKNYRLQINQYVDERRDPIRATEAASKYLADLYTAFQSWELALSAYNCGEYRVLGAMMKGNSRDFWTLDEKGLLPKQTRNYVPKFMAAIMLGENPTEYGLVRPEGDSYPSVELVEVPSPIQLSKIAELADISLDKLQKVNPHILQGITPPNQSTYEIWIPEESVATVQSLKEKLAEFRTSAKPMREKSEIESSENESAHFYTTKKGDTLSRVANRFGISLAYLRNMNGLKKSSKLSLGQRLRVSSSSYRPGPLPHKQYHFVKRGQSLSSIAKRYHTTPSELRSLNHLKNDRLSLGQRLNLPSSDKAQSNKNTNTNSDTTVDTISYTIKQGDTLVKIARHHKVKVKDLRKANNMNGDHKLKISQQIMIPSNRS